MKGEGAAIADRGVLGTGGAFLTLSTLASSLLRAGFLILAGRLLGPEPYAELYAALSAIFLLGTGLTPMGSAIAHYASLYAARDEPGKIAFLAREMPRRLAKWSLVLLVVGALAAYPARRILGFESLTPPLLVVAALAVTLQLSGPRGLLRGLRIFRSYGINILAESFLRIAIAVPLLSMSATATSGLLAYLLAGLGALLLGTAQIAPRVSAVEPVAADPRPLERMVGPLLLFALATATFQNLDMLVVKGFFPAADAGLYAAASSVAKLTALAFFPFSVANLPIFTAALARGEALGKKLLQAVTTYLLIAGGMVLFLAFQGPWVLRILYGEAYVDAAPWLLPLAAALTLGFVAAMIAQAFCAARQYGFLFILGAGLVAEIVALAKWGTSLHAIPVILLGVHGLVLTGLVVLYRTRPPRGATS